MKSAIFPVVAATLLLATFNCANAAPPPQGEQHPSQAQQPPFTPPIPFGTKKPKTFGKAKAFPFPGASGYEFGHKPLDWQHRPSRMEFERQQHTYFGEQPHHWSPYHRPPGWYFRRWSFGDVLPRIFWGSEYRIFDYWSFGLPIPPVDCDWVRYDDDALLIDLRNGEVIEVIYDYF